VSYDLMVFEPAAAPPDRAGFLAWYHRQTEWGEGHDYNDPANASEKLRAWFLDFIKTFPAMNGPYASENYDDPKVSDYSIGRSAIYVAFAWSQAEAAYRAMFETAKAFGLGFYDVSAGDGQVWLPNSHGEYVCVHSD
jgi:hypothetical protein